MTLSISHAPSSCWCSRADVPILSGDMHRQKISKIGRGMLRTLNIKVAAVGFTGSRDQSTTNRQSLLRPSMEIRIFL